MKSCQISNRISRGPITICKIERTQISLSIAGCAYMISTGRDRTSYSARADIRMKDSSPFYLPHAQTSAIASPSVWRPLTVCAILTLTTALIDVFTFGINVTMLYVIPLLLLGRPETRRFLWPFTGIALCLTYGLYFSDFGNAVFTHPEKVLTWRLINRSMVAVSLCIVTTVLSRWLRSQQRMAINRIAALDRSLFDELADSLQQMTCLFLCVVLIACIATTDLITPGEFNLPLLYAVPLIVAYWAGSRRLLRSLLPIMMLLGILGYCFGRQADIAPNWFSKILTNRILSILTTLFIALILHGLIPARRRTLTAPNKGITCAA